ncbi:hypothetical protein ACFE04_006904 [Oxalis oulophora]
MEKSKSFPQYSSFSSSELGTNSYSFNGPIDDKENSELKRKKRVASYNVFTMEGKVKSSFRNSFKWIKNKFTDVRYGKRSIYHDRVPEKKAHTHQDIVDIISDGIMLEDGYSFADYELSKDA